MTEPHDDHSSTRPISVAELLAKNGTIGSPPVGGRRRRRRGNADSVTVAELTGEIPIVTGHTDVEDLEESLDAEADVEQPVAQPIEADVPAPTNGAVEHAPETPPAEADYVAHIEQRDADPEPLDFAPPPRRPMAAPRTGFSAQAGGAEQMSPDPLVDDDEDSDELDLGSTSMTSTNPPTTWRPPRMTSHRTASRRSPVARPTCGRARTPCSAASRWPTTWPVGGGSRGRRTSTSATRTTSSSPSPRRKPPRRGVRRSCGASGWWASASWPSPSAPACSSRSTSCGSGTASSPWCCRCWSFSGLVVGVRVVRKTEDIGSTLIAVAVGAMVTLGPLALLQAH